MSTILSTNAQAMITNIVISSTRVSPSVNINFANPGYLAYEILLTVPSTGSISLLAEASTNGGTTWFPIATDGADGMVPKAGNSSSIRFFSRYEIKSTGVYTVRARVTDVTGTWVVQSARAEIH
jgi:hypothetical protein